jgi:CheY-like chemotaxis protein
MNGKISVISEVNRGSEFLFTIKTGYPQNDDQYLKTFPNHANMKGKKILIVDSNSTSNAILYKLSENLGMNPLSANSAKMTLSIINEIRDYDLILIDNDLKDMESNLLAFEIKKVKENANIPLIVITYPYATDKGSIVLNNFQVRINKPLKHSQLISYLADLFSNSKNSPVQSIRQQKQIQKINELFPLNILVAEDNAINQKLILRLFEMLGYNINIAANGFEVIDALNRMEFDIVFMDIQMPEMDGFEATRQIIAKWPDQRPLIVAMTANALTSDREKCLAAGMDDYISKPLTIDQVSIGIEKWASLCNIRS